MEYECVFFKKRDFYLCVDIFLVRNLEVNIINDSFE